MRALVITVSDRCSSGTAEDTSGPAVCELLRTHLHDLSCKLVVVPDNVNRIQRVVLEHTDAEQGATESMDLIITTGGTGFAPRDITPEAITPLLHRQAPGFVHAMLRLSMDVTPFGSLSRPVAGVRSSTIIVTVPGSKKGATECTSALFPALKHALELTRSKPTSHDPAAVNVGSGVVDEVPLKKLVTERQRNSSFPMLPMNDALAVVESYTKAGEVEEILVCEALLGRTVAADVVAALNIPPYRASIKDGYAVVASDGPGIYPVQSVAVAGSESGALPQLNSGCIARVNTGGPVPNGDDVGVVQVEDTRLVEKDVERDIELSVEICKGVKAGHDIRPIGCDVHPGQVIVSRGTVVGPPEMALLHSIGCKRVTVFCCPTVGVLSTGDELVPMDTSAGSTLPDGKIYDSNTPMLMSALLRDVARSNIVNCGIASDTMADTYKKVKAALAKCRVVITSGGVSMGEVDCLKNVLVALGGTIHFGRVNMKPGKPATFATFPDGSMVFALPGNPVSAMVCYHLFVAPALRRMAGHPSPENPVVAAELTTDFPLDKERPEFHRSLIRFDVSVGRFKAVSTGLQASHRLASMSGANALLALPAGAQPMTKGSVVDALVIDRLNLL